MGTVDPGDAMQVPPPASTSPAPLRAPAQSSKPSQVVQTGAHQPILLPPPGSGDDKGKESNGSAGQKGTSGSGGKPPMLPPPSPLADQQPGCPPHESKVLPINLDTVLRLAEEQNTQIAIDREKVHEAQAQSELADKSWLPDVYVGVAYWRHDGGIVSPETGLLFTPGFSTLFGGPEICGKLDLREATYQKVKAESELWEKREDLSKMTYERLLDAATTYIDLLTARTAEVIADEVGTYLKKLHDDALRLAEEEPSAKVMSESLKAALHIHYQTVLKLRQEGNAASAKLAYLLGLDRCTDLVPVDQHLAPLDLVNPGACVDDLVQQALANGPGVQELEGLIATIQRGIDKSHGPGKYLPVFELKALEGGFGAGPNDNMVWANRFDLGLQVRWNLTDLLTAKEKSQLANSRLSQAQLGYDDLQGRLTLGVRQSLDAIQTGLAQIQASDQAIVNSRQAYKLSRQRFDELVKGRSFQEVIDQVRQLQSALSKKIQAVSEFDKAEIQLSLLLGASNCRK